MADMGVFFNPKRYSLIPFWESSLFHKSMSQWFMKMFDSMGFGTWKISREWANYKKKHGRSSKPNIDTGRMRKAMISRTGASSDTIRIHDKISMTWGVNIYDFPREYPQYPNTKNKFNWVDNAQSVAISDMIVGFLYNKLKSRGGLKGDD